MKGRKRQGRKKKRRKGLSKKESLYGILLSVVIISILFIYFSLRSSSNQTNGTFQSRAAIVDHLSLTQPNHTFNQTTINILEKAGFTVDYYPGEVVTVEFYRNLTAHGYGLILLRVHSAVAVGTTRLVLFTSEPYSETKYVYEQLTGQIGMVAFAPYNEEDPRYFGIDYKFVERSMNGRFEKTIIFMMGCDGLTYTAMAEAFIQKGARVCIGWDGPVLAGHTDQATTQLLEHLIAERKTIEQAVTETLDEVGPDPVDESILLYYPTTPEAGNYIIPEPKSNITRNVAKSQY